MAQYNASAAGFSLRPPGTPAVCLQSVVRAAHERTPLHEAEHAVLMFGDGRVHVRAIREEIDGSFTGDIYGYEGPAESVYGQIPIGDTLNFDEEHVFRYSAPQSRAASVMETPESDETSEIEEDEAPAPRSRGLRYLLVATVAAAIALPLGYMWADARPPETQVVHPATFAPSAGLRLEYDLRR